MEHYIVSARKYRPSNFRSVVGQQALTATLKNAIATQHLAHAYLFCGPRGVGKTTCARIFAKTINCMNLTPEGEACNECESCRSFNEQRSFNIHELDAASNNSVDDIRNLVEQVRVPPQIGKYSVYIIDEVHMLSNQAFNAFLKTLEEPPAHAIFILATTEKHKIIPTILSRCQIYDFNRIRISDTVEHLQYVAQSENVTAEVEALNVIAQKADGAMRDALSIFDQVVSFCGGNITYDQVIKNLNILDYDYYFRLVAAFLANDVQTALLIFNEILNKGFEAQHFVTGLAEHLRDVMVSRDPETLVLLEVGSTIAEKYKQQAQLCATQFLYKALELTNECDLSYRQSKNKRLLVEILLIRLCSLTNNSELGKKAKPELMKIAVDTASALQNTTTASSSASKPQSAIQNAPTTTAAKPVARPVAAASEKIKIEVTALPKRPGTSASAQKVATQAPSEKQQTEEKSSVSPFTLQILHNVWIKYAKSIEKEAHTTNTMLNFLPTIVDDNTIRIELVNNMQIDAIQSHKQKLIKYLQQSFNKPSLNLQIVIDETKHSQVALTPEEWVQKLVQTNPSFQELKQKLKLELL